MDCLESRGVYWGEKEVAKEHEPPAQIYPLTRLLLHGRGQKHLMVLALVLQMPFLTRLEVELIIPTDLNAISSTCSNALVYLRFSLRDNNLSAEVCQVLVACSRLKEWLGEGHILLAEDIIDGPAWTCLGLEKFDIVIHVPFRTDLDHVQCLDRVRIKNRVTCSAAAEELALDQLEASMRCSKESMRSWRDSGSLWRSTLDGVTPTTTSGAAKTSGPPNQPRKPIAAALGRASTSRRSPDSARSSVRPKQSGAPSRRGSWRDERCVRPGGSILRSCGPSTCLKEGDGEVLEAVTKEGLWHPSTFLPYFILPFPCLSSTLIITFSFLATMIFCSLFLRFLHLTFILPFFLSRTVYTISLRLL